MAGHNKKNINSNELEKKVIEYLKSEMATLIKLPAHRIHSENPFEHYGIDSVMMIDLTAKLEITFGPLSKTLFFEFQNIKELSLFFIESHYDRLIQLLYPSNETKAPKLPKENSLASNSTNRKGLIPPNQSRFKIINKPQKNVSVVSVPLLVPENKKSVIQAKKQERVETSSRKPFTAKDRLSTMRWPDAPPPLNIAIIGVSGRYPQAKDLSQFWRNLRDGKDCISEVPENRWDWRAYYTEDNSVPGRHSSKWGGFIDDVDKFDSLFFNISPQEAMFMDPQERLFLEYAWCALEDAGYRPSDLQKEGIKGLVGVYAGIMYGDYQLYGAQESVRGNPLALSSSFASVANRVSYFFNLHGPSMSVDTMCSSSLTSVHLACQDLHFGATNLGIAGGVNLSIHPNKYLMLSSTRFISSKGRCESFGKGGDGYIPGEGVGIVILKRLEDAWRDNDHIYAIIKGSALNHGGKTNGYTVPNPNAQAMVIKRALTQAAIDPGTVSYIEAHGTGTRLGDPIEISGLTKAFVDGTATKQSCWIGSVKSNIGHCESAAGIAGLTKVLLQMQHGQIAPSLHSITLNPNIDFSKTPFIVNQELRTWERPVIDGKTCPRIAGISAFGAGGANAHLLIEEAQEMANMNMDEDSNLSLPGMIVLSARKPERLNAYARKLLQFVEEKERYGQPIRLLDLAYTLQMGREAMEVRLGMIVHSMCELVEKLQAFLNGKNNIINLYVGHLKRRDGRLPVIVPDAHMLKIINIWKHKKDYHKFVELWVKGFDINWNDLNGGHKPRRISAPTYPFSGKRYWVEAAASHASNQFVGG